MHHPIFSMRDIQGGKKTCSSLSSNPRNLNRVQKRQKHAKLVDSPRKTCDIDRDISLPHADSCMITPGSDLEALGSDGMNLPRPKRQRNIMTIELEECKYLYLAGERLGKALVGVILGEWLLGRFKSLSQPSARSRHAI
jgi:hypothetical protein